MTDEVEKKGRKSRHLRQIESITCTEDGSYALIFCSDNTMFLYSLCNILGHGLGPSRSFNGRQNSKASQFKSPTNSRVTEVPREGYGFITLLSQLKEGLKCEVSLKNVGLDGHISPCSCSLSEEHPHSSPTSLLAAVAWWEHSDPSSTAILRTTRLFCTNDNTASTSVIDLVPYRFAEPFHSDYSQRAASAKHNKPCCLCGDEVVSHWDELKCGICSDSNLNQYLDEDSKDSNNSHSTTSDLSKTTTSNIASKNQVLRIQSNIVYFTNTYTNRGLASYVQILRK